MRHDKTFFSEKNKKNIALSCFIRYTLRMSNTNTIATSQVQNLSFDSIADAVDSNWSEWFVSFMIDGIAHVGILGACPNHPSLMHGDMIEEIELA